MCLGFPILGQNSSYCATLRPALPSPLCSLLLRCMGEGRAGVRSLGQVLPCKSDARERRCLGAVAHFSWEHHPTPVSSLGLSSVEKAADIVQTQMNHLDPECQFSQYAFYHILSPDLPCSQSEHCSVSTDPE